MDLVYVYKRQGDEREIRYSLRSVARNLRFDRVVIVGDLPAFAHNVVHLPYNVGAGKHANSSNKLFYAASHPQVSDPFILMNDDFFILQPFDEIPYLYMKTLGNWIKTFPHESSYKKKAIKTAEMIGSLAKIFELHFPFVYEKQKLRDLQRKYALPCGIMTRTLYAAEYGIAGEQSRDYKATTGEEVVRYSRGRFMSTSYEAAAASEFLTMMRARFPEPCRFER